MSWSMVDNFFVFLAVFDRHVRYTVRDVIIFFFFLFLLSLLMPFYELVELIATELLTIVQITFAELWSIIYAYSVGRY